MSDVKLAPGFWRTQHNCKAQVIGQAQCGRWVGMVYEGSDKYGASWDDQGASDHTGSNIREAWHEPIKGEAVAVLREDGTVDNIQIGGIVNYRGTKAPSYVRIRYEEIPNAD